MFFFSISFFLHSFTGKMLFDGKSEIQEIEVAGNFAYCWSHLTLTVTPLPSGSPSKRAGHILSIFRREEDGRWVLFRDANMLTAV
jgi:ketosteroid isomerase-like protein